MGIEEEGKVTNETGHFLDDKQKKLKGKIMVELMEALFGNIAANKEILTHQSVIDIFGSILLMFNRDVLVHFLMSFNLVHNRKDIMKNIFEQIRDEVNRVIKRNMQ